MLTLDELKNTYYQEFKGLPGNMPIVRNNQPNDAFEMVVLKVLYGKTLPEFIKENATIFSSYVIAPPDCGIDIFFQHENGDESSFDVIQVKDSVLTENEIRECFLKMKRTISDYLKNPNTISSESCKSILRASNLDSTNKSNCTYYVVHSGDVDDFLGSEDDEKIITKTALKVIYNNVNDCVDSDTICVDSYMKYQEPGATDSAYVCSVKGSDLAELCNKYFNTEVGRNLLFGSNLRESLITKKSKPYQSMRNTITECPQKFWYYNNGITIIARNVEVSGEASHKIKLTNFSIVNGAQTTSSLGLYLREARKNNEIDKIASLDKVYVLTRILNVSDNEMRRDIAIYNNTQNPITSRDMVSQREEQKHLYEWLIDDSEYPQILVDIRRGQQIPASFPKYITHRRITNEELAQLAYAYFLQKPFTAKDKKSALFNNNFSQTDYMINEIYHKIFYWDRNETNPNNYGVIFTKTKAEIDEALFVQQLYREAKKNMKKTLVSRIENWQTEKQNETNAVRISQLERRIIQSSQHLDTSGICMFYFLALYTEFKATYPYGGDKSFNYEMYYTDKNYKNRLIDKVSNLFLKWTVQILVKTANEAAKASNMNNWLRSANCEKDFFVALRDTMASDLELEDEYHKFIDEFKFENR